MAHLGLIAAAFVAFLAPGWFLSRRLASPMPVVSALLASSAILFNLLLLLGALRIALTPANVACAFMAVAAALFLWALRAGVPLLPSLNAGGLPRGLAWLWLVPAALALVSIAARGVMEPLSGFDNLFRWDYLARLLLHRHSMDFYPPARAQDFDLYSWCDGIPPLASVLNFGIYAAAGSENAALIAVRAAAEFLVIAALCRRLSARLWGAAAGLASAALLGASALFVWGIAIEQENGLVAIGLLAMLCFLGEESAADREGGSAALWAGVAAGFGGISREYGLYFVIFGAVLLLADGRKRRIAVFLTSAACVAAPWYVRNWVKTGNPMYPALGAVFPTNPIHAEVMSDIAHFMGFRTSPFPLKDVPLTLLATAGAVGVAALVGAVRLARKSFALVAASGLVAGLWIWAMPLTAGGWNYSMKVLVPAVALGSVLGGWLGALRGRWLAAAVLLVALLAVDAARRSWVLPDDPFTSPWTLSFDEWRFFQAQQDAFRRRDIWPVLSGVAGNRFIVVDNPQAFVALAAAGGHPVPFESPRAAPLFDPSIGVDEATLRLREAGFRFVTFSVGNPVIDRLIARHPVLSGLAHDYTPTAKIGGLVIFDLEFPAPKKAPAPRT